jgi:hypothetical protein
MSTERITIRRRPAPAPIAAEADRKWRCEVDGTVLGVFKDDCVVVRSGRVNMTVRGTVDAVCHKCHCLNVITYPPVAERSQR